MAYDADIKAALSGIKTTVQGVRDLAGTGISAEDDARLVAVLEVLGVAISEPDPADTDPPQPPPPDPDDDSRWAIATAVIGHIRGAAFTPTQTAAKTGATWSH